MSPAGDVRVLSGAPWPTLLEAAFAVTRIGDAGAQPAVIATADATALADEVDRALARAGIPATVLAAPASTLDAVRGLRTTRWASVRPRARTQRIGRVSLPEALAPGRRIIAFSDLTAFDPRNPVVCIGLWAGFARPLTRLGALASRPRDGLVAEIASAVDPELILLAASWAGRPLLFATRDQIAAELAGLALGAAQRDPDLERTGPWEHPLVQHATELDLGVRTPAGMTLRPIWVGGETGGGAFLKFVDLLALAIGCGVAVEGESISPALEEDAPLSIWSGEIPPSSE